MDLPPLEQVHDRLSETVPRLVQSHAIAGAVVVVGDHDRLLPEIVVGARRRAMDGRPARPMTAAASFDLASLTKVVVTLPTVLRLASDGVLDVDAPLTTWFPNAGWFREPSSATATPRQLLSHTSGLPAWAPFVGTASDRLTVIGHALGSALAHPPGSVVYSDLGFIVLGRLAEVLTGRRLDVAALESVHGPLGIDADLGFRPLAPATREAAAQMITHGASDVDDDRGTVATERCGWRGRCLDGEVHDEAAWIMGGVAGHAGAFGTARAVARYAQAWMRFDPALGDPTVLAQAEQRATAPGQPARGLGWVLAPDDLEPQADDEAATDWRGRRGIGHTGFTGTSVWIDRTGDRVCVILTNRVHPTRLTGPGISVLRRTVHDLVFGPLDA